MTAISEDNKLMTSGWCQYECPLWSIPQHLAVPNACSSYRFRNKTKQTEDRNCTNFVYCDFVAVAPHKEISTVWCIETITGMLVLTAPYIDTHHHKQAVRGPQSVPGLCPSSLMLHTYLLMDTVPLEVCSWWNVLESAFATAFAGHTTYNPLHMQLPQTCSVKFENIILGWVAPSQILERGMLSSPLSRICFWNIM